MQMNNKELNLLKLFSKNCELLISHSIIKNNQLKVKTSINYHFDSGWSAKREEIPIEQFESLQLRIRRLNNKKDDIYLPKIAGILLKNNTENIDVINLRKVKKLFCGTGVNVLIKQSKNGVIFTEENIFDLFINGKYFHSNLNSLSKLKEIECVDGLEWDMFKLVIINKVNAIILINKYIENKFIDG